MTLSIGEVQYKIRVLVLEHIIDSSDIVNSMDAIDKLRNVTIYQNHVQFSKVQWAVALQPQGSELMWLKVQDKGFCAKFNSE